MQPPPEFSDPRLENDFNPDLWPRLNGADAPAPGTGDAHDRRSVELLAAYYRINVLNRQLIALRSQTLVQSESATKVLVRQIHGATLALGSIEDRYAPIGFFGEPTLEGVWYRDVLITRPGVPKIHPEPSSVSSFIAIPGLEDIPASELQGPAVVRRWHHGKMDF